MRFFLILFFFFLFTALPCLDLHIKWYRQGKHIILQKALWMIPATITLSFYIIQQFTDFNRITIWYMWGLFTTLLTVNTYMTFDLIARYTSKRTSLILRCTGGALVLPVLAFFIAGMLQRHDIKIRSVEISLPDLPASFDGKRIVQITDMHLGNLTPQYSYLQRIVTTINSLNPDLIFFTGDMVNLRATDSQSTDTVLCRLSARIGKYAVLGNHDYGDYSNWETPEAKSRNLQQTKDLYRHLGFTLLCDTALYICNGTDSIGLIGVENCGHAPFPKYGDMDKATAGFTSSATNILLSHDPNHWEEEILVSYPWIDLTLAGHTHGAQLGIELPYCTWSPAQWVFKHWDGHYQEGNQHLFVSRGLGYVGIPFRLGMYPEITLITIRRQ
ncbi:MAG: metallophosphoesterase [Candidatus Aphodosoma sp.]